MQIDNGLVAGVRFVRANSFGSALMPRWIVLHDTAGALRKFSSVEWFASKECKTSAHFVVERDGTITQCVPTNRRAYHAGQSQWKGVSGLNSCSIGIEIVNPGKLDEKGNADFGKVAEPSEIIAKSSANHGKGYWLPYTQPQVEAVIALCRAIVEEYPDCNEIVTHYEIAPRRKIDVGPHFPLEEVRKSVFDPTPGEVAQASDTATLVSHQGMAPGIGALASIGSAIRYFRSAFKILWAPIGAAVLWLAQLVQSAFDWVAGRVDDAVALVSTVQKDVEGDLAPFEALVALFKGNLASIIAALAVVLTLVALYKAVCAQHKADVHDAQAPPEEKPA